MDKQYLSAKKRARKGSHRQDKIVSIRIPERTKIFLDNWKAGYEAIYGAKVTYEQMFQWWMDNIGYTEGPWDKSVREKIDLLPLPFVNMFRSKGSIVNYLNEHGYFWEYGNRASQNISDEEVIFKSLLYMQFEDIPQLFVLYGREKCKEVFEERIKSRGDYYSIISFLLNVIFFNDGTNHRIDAGDGSGF